MSLSSLRLLDGGMGRELARIGAPFRQPEWSALALIEAPQFVLQAHQAFIRAGARIITSNSYAVVPFHIGEQRFAEHGLALAERAGRLARQAAEAGGTAPAMLNAANEVAVAAFLEDQIGFLAMSDLNEYVMNQGTFIANPTLEDYIESDKISRALAHEWVSKNRK